MNGIMEIRRQVRLSQWSAMVREREESGKHIVGRSVLPPRRITTGCAGLEKLRLNKCDPKQLSLSLYNSRHRQNTLSDKRKASSSRPLIQPSKFR